MSTLSQRIKSARENAGLLQSELATCIGVKSAGVISNWEKDKSKPDADKIVSLCSALEVSCSYLLDYYGSENVTASEVTLLTIFRKLNDEGQQVVMHTIEGLVASNQYIKTNSEVGVVESA